MNSLTERIETIFTHSLSMRNSIKAKIATLRELTRHVAFFGRYIQIRFLLLEKTLRFAQKEAIARRSNLRCKDQQIISCLLYAKVTGKRIHALEKRAEESTFLVKWESSLHE